MESKSLRIQAMNLQLVELASQGRAACGEADLSDAEALALAQLLKRLTWSDMRGCAVDDEETALMRDAVEKLQHALAGAHYSPR